MNTGLHYPEVIEGSEQENLKGLETGPKCLVRKDRNLTEHFVVVVLLFYDYGKHLRSCRDGQLT